jgi:hypothetical protein
MSDGRILRENPGKQVELLKRLPAVFEGAWYNGVER